MKKILFSEHCLSILFLTMLSLTMLSLTTVSFAKSTIFKCLDEFGRPIFSQQATCDKPDTVNYSSKQQAKKQKQQQRDKQQLAHEKKKKQCDEAKATHESYKRAPFLTKQVVSEGKNIKVRLTKEEAQQAISDAMDEVEYWCKDN